MTQQMRWTVMALGFAGLAVPCMQGARAQDAANAAGQTGVDRAVTTVSTAHEAASHSQKKVEQLSDRALDLTTQYRNLERRIASLDVYNDQLRTLLSNQEIESNKLHTQLGEVSVVGRQVLPLMQRMVESLASFVALDVPFLLEERNKRVASLRKLLTRADVNNAEKYRRVLEAYQIENEYGRTIEAYKGRVSADGGDRSVEFLRIGRVTLIYRTLDGLRYGQWDSDKRAWTAMTSGYEREIVAGLRIAREQAAPNLIRVPVPVPEASR